MSGLHMKFFCGAVALVVVNVSCGFQEEVVPVDSVDEGRTALATEQDNDAPACTAELIHSYDTCQGPLLVWLLSEVGGSRDDEAPYLTRPGLSVMEAWTALKRLGATDVQCLSCDDLPLPDSADDRSTAEAMVQMKAQCLLDNMALFYAPTLPYGQPEEHPLWESSDLRLWLEDWSEVKEQALDVNVEQYLLLYEMFGQFMEESQRSASHWMYRPYDATGGLPCGDLLDGNPYPPSSARPVSPSGSLARCYRLNMHHVEADLASQELHSCLDALNSLVSEMQEHAATVNELSHVSDWVDVATRLTKKQLRVFGDVSTPLSSESRQLFLLDQWYRAAHEATGFIDGRLARLPLQDIWAAYQTVYGHEEPVRMGVQVVHERLSELLEDFWLAAENRAVELEGLGETLGRLHTPLDVSPEEEDPGDGDTLEELIAQYHDAARQHGSAKNSKTANKAARQLAVTYRQIRELGSVACEGLLAFLVDDDSSVRSWAAAHALEFAPEKGEATLEALASGPPGPIRANATMTLREWRAGRLHFP
jgi:hypothetical protein